MSRQSNAAVEAAEEVASATVAAEGEPVSFPVEPGQCVLDAGLAAGAPMAYGCRVGVCGACAVEVVEGGAATESPDPIEADALARFALGKRVRLACRLRLLGPVRLVPA